MNHRERQRLADIQAAIDAIRSHLRRGDLSDGLVFDAIRVREPPFCAGSSLRPSVSELAQIRSL